MTDQRKERIIFLRNQGKGYGSIASELGIPESTVKSFCRRNDSSASIAPAQSGDACGHCGLPFTHTPGARKKRFCSSKCRMAWWNAHPETVNRKTFHHFRCGYCDAAFESYGNARRKYCSRPCAATANRGAQ